MIYFTCCLLRFTKFISFASSLQLVEIVGLSSLSHDVVEVNHINLSLHTHLLFHLALTYSRMSFMLGLSDAFLIVRLGLWALGRKTLEVKGHSLHIISYQEYLLLK